MNGSVIVVAQVRSETLRGVVGERLAALESFYAPLGIVSQEHAWHPRMRLIAEQTTACAQSRTTRPLWTWGEPLPATLAAPRRCWPPRPASSAPSRA